MNRKHEKTNRNTVHSHHRNTFSIPGETETYKSKTGFLTRASFYSKTFPYPYELRMHTVVFLFRPHLQLRVQLWIFTRFPIKPSWHLYFLENYSIKLDSILDESFLFFNYLYNENDRFPTETETT